MSRTARDLPIRTPGAAPATPAAADQAAPAAAETAERRIPTPEETAAEEAAMEAEIAASANEPAPAGDAAQAAQPPTSVEQLQAYIDKKVSEGVAAGIKQIQRAQLKNSPGAVEIPDQSQVDVDKIKDQVLSKQGWVIPRNYGKVPDHIRTQIQLGQTH